MQLAQIIIDKIKTEGPLSFRDFMDLALYHPRLGYYTSSADQVGPAGDFYTSVRLSASFGALIAIQLEEMWSVLGKQPFTIVEYGGGTGQLSMDILGHLQNNSKLYDALQYCVIEKNAALKSKGRAHEKLSWHESAAELGSINGCVLSHEVVDNFPVHQVRMGAELEELFVDHSGAAFREIAKPASESLKNYFKELNVTLPAGFLTEVNLDAQKWLNEVSRCLHKGFVLTIDYGYPGHRLYRAAHSSGTLLCYHRHHITGDPYNNIGDQDMTAHVNFSALCHWGFRNGLHCNGLTNQAFFLLALGLKEQLRLDLEKEGKSPLEAAIQEALITRTLLLEMGSKYQVLIQRKGIPYTPLRGFKLN
jgi:SAM-dependent MidA family methyltransferase